MTKEKATKTKKAPKADKTKKAPKTAKVAKATPAKRAGLKAAVKAKFETIAAFCAAIEITPVTYNYWYSRGGKPRKERQEKVNALLGLPATFWD